MESGNPQNETSNRKLDSIEAALQDIKAGKIIIVVDDEDRENEGDFICAAELITPTQVNFMATHGRGLICTPLTAQRCDELELRPMQQQNTAVHETAFTVSIDLLGYGCSTGISAYDRATGIQKLTASSTRSSDYARPGHIFPLIAKDGGVLRRAGHTEAAVDLARLAGLQPAGVLVEILNEDGTMARLPDLFEIADKHQLKIISIEDLIKYRLHKETLIEKVITVNMPTEYGTFEMVAFEDKTTGKSLFALSKGTWTEDEPVLVRVHSSCVTGDILGSLRCDCGPQLHAAMRQVHEEGKGVVLYIQQEGRGIGLMNKLKAYKLQEEGLDTVEANHKLGFKADQRDYGIGAQVLRQLGISKLRLMTNNPKKRIGLIGYGLEIVSNIPLEIEANPHNEEYLRTKRDKLGHNLFQSGLK
jgi:3,4-dihydroxy 2-butanone 4-phosphate synthase/GTP cyclohydrolase II